MSDRNRKTADIEKERLFREIEERRHLETLKAARAVRRRRNLKILASVLLVAAVVIALCQLRRLDLLPGLSSSAFSPAVGAKPSAPADAPPISVSFVREGRVLNHVTAPPGAPLKGRTTWKTFPTSVTYDVQVRKQVEGAWLVGYDLVVEGGGAREAGGPLVRRDVVRVQAGTPVTILSGTPIEVVLVLGTRPEMETASGPGGPLEESVPATENDAADE